MYREREESSCKFDPVASLTVFGRELGAVMAVTLKDYLDRPLESYCSEILDEWKNLSRIDVPVLTCMSCKSAHWVKGEVEGTLQQLVQTAARRLVKNLPQAYKM